MTPYITTVHISSFIYQHTPPQDSLPLSPSLGRDHLAPLSPTESPLAEVFEGWRPGNLSVGAQCGILNQPPSLRITGGQETARNRYPWMAALIFK